MGLKQSILLTELYRNPCPVIGRYLRTRIKQPIRNAAWSVNTRDLYGVEYFSVLNNHVILRRNTIGNQAIQVSVDNNQYQNNFKYYTVIFIF